MAQPGGSGRAIFYHFCTNLYQISIRFREIISKRSGIVPFGGTVLHETRVAYSGTGCQLETNHDSGLVWPMFTQPRANIGNINKLPGRKTIWLDAANYLILWLISIIGQLEPMYIRAVQLARPAAPPWLPHAAKRRSHA